MIFKISVMTRYLHFYKWLVAVIVLICSTATMSAQTKVTSLSLLKAGSVIKIYPKDSDGTSHYGESKYALACSGDGQSLTSYEKAGSGDKWTLENAGGGCFYLKNEKGCYWAYQGRSSSRSLKCTIDKSSAVKISLTWDTKYSGVCFWNGKDGSGLNNLYEYNNMYNWWSNPNNYSNDANTTFDITLLGNGNGGEVIKPDENTLVKVTSVSQLKAGCVIKIYPNGHYGESKHALACSGDGQSLTSYEKAGSGYMWTLVDAGDGCCYLKNEKGCYWAYQGYSSTKSLKCTMDKSSAVRIYLSWDIKYGGVCFWLGKNDRGLNNLGGYNYMYNWWSDPNNYSNDANTTFDVALLKEGSGNDFVKPLKVTSVSQLKAGSVIKIYAKDKYGQSCYGNRRNALECMGDGEPLTYSTIQGSYDEWILEDAGEGYCYIKNKKGCYWAYQGSSSVESLKCTIDKSSAVKIALTWDYINKGVCFWNEKDRRGLKNLDEYNISYNWCSDPIINSRKAIETFDIALLKEGSGNVFSGGYSYAYLYGFNGIQFRVYPNKTAELLNNDYSGDFVIPEVITNNNVTYKVTSLEVSCFEGCSSLTSITLPASLTSLGNDCFRGCSSLTSIFCLAVNPPSCTKSVVDNTKILYVPKESVEKYKRSGVWSNAKGIYPLYPTSSVSLAKEVSVNKAKPTKLEYTILPENAGTKELEWSSENPEVAIVDANGVVTGKKMGKTVITAKTKDGTNITVSTILTVLPLKVETMVFAEPSVSIVKTKDKTIKLTLNSEEVDNKSMVWTSSDESVATVVQNMNAVYPIEAIVVAHKVGDAIITATATDGSGISASTTIHVTPLKVSQIEMPKEISLLHTLSKQIEVNISPELADNKTLKWTSDNEDIATVTQEGVAKGVNVGTTNITATAMDGSGVSATCKVTVKHVTIELSTNTINLQKGSAYVEQTTTVLPEDYEHKDVVWTTSGNGVASVDKDGHITANKPGVDTLRCSLSYDSHIYSECRVIVYEDNVVYVGGLYYLLNREATVTSIYGGKNTSLDAKNVAQYYSGTINIPETIIYDGNKYTVRKVGSYAFSCQNELQSIYIPRTVTEVEPHAAIKAEKLNRVNVADESELENIGEEAFKWCTGLKRFTFDGTSLKMNSIDKAAFRECTALERFTWMGNTTVKTIGHSAFYDCPALEKVLWNGKSELKTIQDYAFFKCTSLNNFDMPNTTLSVGNSSFRYNASLTDIHLSTSLNYIDEYAFGECGFSHITLPESLANIQAGAFINNEHLQDITLPERLQGLSSAAFENNSALESVTFHTALETMTIGNNAFNLCPVLSKVFITNMKSFAQTNFNNAKANPANTSQHIYNADGEEIINVVLPKGTKYINNNAFNGCAYMQSIKMPATMDHINDDIFVGCSALKDVYCYAEEVPEFIGVNDPSAMNDVFANATLHVVFGHEQAYKADAWWKRFSNVEGCDAPSDDEVTSVVLNQTELTMKPDDTIQLTATVYPANAANKKLVWTSSNDDVAMVTDEGFVLAMAEGEADITATSAENSSIKAVCHIKVENEKEPVVTIVGIKFEESPVTISMGDTKKLNVIFNPVDATNKQLEWKSTKTSVVDVDQDGNIIGVSEGKAIITAKTTDGSNLTINCVVTVVPSTGINDINIGDVKLTVENRRLKVEGLTEKDIIQVVDYAGSTIYRGTDHEVYLNTSGVYIVKVKGKTMKIHVK